MCGNGCSCEECPSAPCGPTPDKVDGKARYQNFMDQGICPHCEGKGSFGRNDSFRWCKGCKGTGKFKPPKD